MNSEELEVSVTPKILAVMKNIELYGWKLRKHTGKCTELFKEDESYRVPYSVFGGLRRRDLIEPLGNSEYLVLTAKGEAIIAGKWPYRVIYAMPEGMKEKCLIQLKSLQSIHALRTIRTTQ